MKAIIDAILSKQNIDIAGVKVEYYPLVETPTLARMESAKVFVDNVQIAFYDYERHQVTRSIGDLSNCFIDAIWDALEVINNPLHAIIDDVSYNVIEKPLRHHKLGLPYTASGYGHKLPTRFMVLYNNRWYRVYSVCISNVSSEYIVSNGERITVDLHEA